MKLRPSLSSLLKVLFTLSCLCCTVIFWKVKQSGLDVLEALSTVVVILVACIPIAMQIVSTTVMAVGSRALAEKKAIVARLSAIEELAGMNILYYSLFGVGLPAMAFPEGTERTWLLTYTSVRRPASNQPALEPTQPWERTAR